MKSLDRFVQNWRIRKAVGQLSGKVRVIDVGAHEGELFLALGDRLAEGFGVEPLLPEPVRRERNFTLNKGFFPAVSPEEGNWDAITMLAVLEHVPDDQQEELALACHRLLRPGGKLVITVPSLVVDKILAVLLALRLIDGMSLEEHHGFKPEDTAGIFEQASFKLACHRTFQLGLNHLFVFVKE